MAKRLTRPLTDVVREVEAELKANFGLTDKELEQLRKQAQLSLSLFPNSIKEKIEKLWIDYEVQRDVIYKHILGIMRRWDPRICSPVSACIVLDPALDPEHQRVLTYDGQHRTIAAAILGLKEIPVSVVETKDSNFPSYAFEMLNQTGVKRLTPADLHRNALVRYKNGSHEKRNIQAYKMQKAFDKVGVDLEDKASRKNPSLRGNNNYFFSHFKYAQKAIELEKEGDILADILTAITNVYPLQEEVDQGVFIGLYELQRLAGNKNTGLPKDWMTQVLTKIRQVYKSSHLVHDRAKVQFSHKFPGATWSAPSAMSEFIREVYMHQGGTIALPTHGAGANLGVSTNPAPGLFPPGVNASPAPTPVVATLPAKTTKTLTIKKKSVVK